jgi:hypothetical protein
LVGDAEGALDGAITISFPGTNPNDRLLAQVSQTASTLYGCTQQLRDGLDVTQPSPQIWGGAVAMLRDNSAFDCTFRMLRNGKCFFRVDDARHKLDPTIMHWLISQCYYFLKDAVHQHYHHRRATDAIIELAPARATPDWRFRTLRNLYRKVISLRRSKSERLLSDALGVMTYANVFLAIFNKTDFDSDGNEVVPAPQPLPAYHPEQLRSSIEIRRDSARRDYDRRKTDFQYWIGAFMTIGVIFITICDHFIAGSPAKFWADKLFRIVSYNPVVIVAPAIVIYIGYALRLGVKDPAENLIVRTLYRLFAWFSKNKGVAVLLVITATLLCIAAYGAWQVYLGS